MARLPRLSVPGYPHHIVQRGNNGQPTFHDADDYELLLGLLTEAARVAKVAVHGYVLMDSHFQILATPETTTGLPTMMQAVGRRYVQAFNRRYQRAGTLWEGRYRAAPLEPERYLLTCMAYMDLSPVRAGLVTRAADYRWSSHAHYAGLHHDKRLSPPAAYWQLGNTPFAREAAYIERVKQGVTPAQLAALTDATLKGWALGSTDFITDLQKRTPRRLGRSRPGRPASKPGTHS